MARTNTSTTDTPTFTTAQRKFYDTMTSGRKSHITKQYRKHSGNTPAFKKWFNAYKKNNG